MTRNSAKVGRVLQVFPYWLDPAVGDASGVRDVIESIIQLTSPAWEHIVLVPGPTPFNERFLGAGATDVIELGRTSHLILRRRAGASGIAMHARELAIDVPRIARIIRRRQIDIVHTHSSAYLGAAFAAQLVRTPTIVHIHERMDGLSPRVAAFHRRVTASVATRLVIIAEFMRGEWADVYGKAVLIPNTSTFAFGARPTVVGAPVVGFLGRIAPRKGIEYLIAAMPQVLREVPRARLVIAGGPAEPEDFPYLDRLRNDVARLGLHDIVEFHGPTSDPVRFLTSIRVLAFVSPVDIAPVTVLHAMAAGVPVVTASDGGAQEFVPDAVAGLQVAPRDVTGIAVALVALLRDDELHSRAAEGALQRFSEVYAPHRFRTQIENLYRDVRERT